jgi:hypothetical protein
MAQTQNSHNSAPAVCVTPLYHFTSDVAELVIGARTTIRQCDQCLASSSFDNEILNSFKISSPDYLLIQDSLLSLEYFIQDVSSPSVRQRNVALVEDCLASTRELLRVLRLFKPGRLRAGETFILMEGKDNKIWNSVASGRASDMTVDYFLLRLREKTYALNSSEIPSLQAFRDTLSPVLSKMSSFPAAELALFLYGSDDGERSDLIGAITALEALLTTKDEIEGLTYRLSMRIANLLGNDVDARKGKFWDVKKFYKLRSRMVHGSPLGETHLNQLSELYLLRETLRRVLLSTMALFSENVRPDALPALLDELAFDDDKRKKVQATAARFLHIGADTTMR